jgi:hypothetical protein
MPMLHRWKYLFVHMNWVRPNNWETTLIGDPEAKDWAKDKTEDEISNYLGERGWELVSYTPIVGNPYGTSTLGIAEIRMVFKFPNP